MMALSLSRILLAGWRTRVNPLGNRRCLQLGARDERRRRRGGRSIETDSQQHPHRINKAAVTESFIIASLRRSPSNPLCATCTASKRLLRLLKTVTEIDCWLVRGILYLLSPIDGHAGQTTTNLDFQLRLFFSLLFPAEQLKYICFFLFFVFFLPLGTQKLTSLSPWLLFKDRHPVLSSAPGQTQSCLYPASLRRKS